ncbi:MAG: response regulator transcription factor [Bacteroidia bacterium]|nr:response regulator transcription factor [Bacteroidia bacterium]
MIDIAITDDHLLIINGIKDLLANVPHFRFAGAFASVEETRKGLAASQPDVLLLDINLPDGDGIQLCRELTREYPRLKVLALTTYNQTVLVKNMMKNRASGYLLKNTSLNELKEAIETVYRGEKYLQPEIREALLRDSIGDPTPGNHFRPKLTRREKEVLQLIVDELTTQEIADRLFLSPKTVESHRLNLLQKLGVRNTAGIVKAAFTQGLLDP